MVCVFPVLLLFDNACFGVCAKPCNRTDAAGAGRGVFGTDTHLGTVAMTVQGTDTALVIGRKGNATIETIVPKEKSGWRIPSGFVAGRLVKRIMRDDVTVTIYSSRDSQDHYVTVCKMDGSPLQLTDDCGSMFQCDEWTMETIASGKRIYCTYYAYIDAYDDEYSLTINGEKIMCG